MSDAGIERPRSVFSLGGRQRSDRRLAEDLCAGYFAHAGTRRELSLDPEWVGPGGTMDDWQQALATFAWGLDLAHAYRESAEPRFLAAWERLVQSWIKRSQIEHDPSPLVARRIESWVYAWEAFACAPAFDGFSTGVPRRILASLREQVCRLHAPPAADGSTHPAEAYAILVAVLAFPSLDTTARLLEFATAALRANLLGHTLVDGVYRDGRLPMQCEFLRPHLGLKENARRFGVGLPAEYDARLEQACDVLLHCCASAPGGEHPAAEILACAAELFQRGDFLWAASGGLRGVPPARRNVSFPAGGYHVQRSAWSVAGQQDERFSLLDLSPGDHSLGTQRLEIAAGGQRVLAHIPAAGAPVAQPRLVGRHSAPGLDILHSHAFTNGGDAWHDRQVVFVADEYWIIHDRLSAPAGHRYDLRLQLGRGAHDHATVEAQDGSVAILAPGVSLIIAPGRTPIDVGPVTGSTMDTGLGPIFSVVAESGAETTVTMLVLPRVPGATAPSVEVHESPEATVVEVRGLGTEREVIDWIGWAATSVPLALGEFRVRATAAWIRQSGDGKVLAFGASDAGRAVAPAHDGLEMH